MKIAAINGINPVSTQSAEDTERELVKRIVEARGPESAHDPGVALAARDAAELAHDNGADLVAVVEHPNADPGVLIGMLVTADAPFGKDAPAELRRYLEDSASPEIREVTEARTERGYPVIIAERILVDSPLRTGPPTGCQLQAIILDTNRTLAIFTLHSPTGRGWLDLATLFGRMVATVTF